MDHREKVTQVFASVANSYDIMNDCMSLGTHRLWKRYFVFNSQILPHHQVLDVAAGSGDIALNIAKTLGEKGHVTLLEPEEKMLRQARGRFLDAALIHKASFVHQRAENTELPSASFDRITISFGLRNVSNKEQALAEFFRLAHPQGRLCIMEFSPPPNTPFGSLYSFVSRRLFPPLGGLIARDRAAYQYLVDSIAHFWTPQELTGAMEQAGWQNVRSHSLPGGIVTFHTGDKLA